VARSASFSGKPGTTSSLAALLLQASRLRQSGRLNEALVPYRAAARLEPSTFSIQHDLGLVCLECGLVSEAIAALRRAVQSNPRFAQAHWRLGIALERQGEAVAAIEAYRRAVELRPSLTDAHFRLAMLLEGHGHRTEAIGFYRRAAASAPKTRLGRFAAARALLAEQRDAEAERVLRQSLALDPANPSAHEMLGTILADSGRFEDARDCFERALTHAPQFAGIHYDLVRLFRVTPADHPLVARMQAALGQASLAAEQRLKLHLALGKAADDLGEYAEAMRQFDAADAVRRRILNFDVKLFEARVDRIIARFTPEQAARPPPGSEDRTPVLILGMPRSGTTLVEQIVTSHPEAVAGGELHFWNRRAAMAERAGTAGTEAPFLAEAAADYLRFIRPFAPGAARITDKMPFNFIWAGLIHLVFPHAAIIHCRRSPIDTALSIHQTHFSARLDFPTGGEDLVSYYRVYERLMAHWRRVLPADRFLEVDYETLTARPEPIIRRIVACCGLPWDEACLYPERNERVVRTASKWQARQPIYRTAVERWRRYEPFLGPLRDLLPPEEHS
jgi:Flp pilus assembly protein TadD